jgi:hypothetical protein
MAIRVVVPDWKADRAWRADSSLVSPGAIAGVRKPTSWMSPAAPPPSSTTMASQSTSGISA